MNAIRSQPRREGMPRVMKPEILESRLLTRIPPTRLNGINVHTLTRITEHEILWPIILLEPSIP